MNNTDKKLVLEDIRRRDLILKISIFIFISVLILYADYKYIYPHSALGNPLCTTLSDEGYYETEWDTAGYKDCRILHESRWNPYETNQTCMEARDPDPKLFEYGMHCVWGSAGYWLFVLAYAIPFILLAPAMAIFGPLLAPRYFKSLEDK